MLGFAFFMFEGIGCMMPILNATENKNEFIPLTVLALITLCITYIVFSEICYYAWGADLTESVVTEMLPPANIAVQILKLLFCLNLTFSYPLSIVPTNETIE